MTRHLLHLTFALLTFAVGTFAWDACRTLDKHGLTPARRLLRIRPAPAPRAAEAPPPLGEAIDGARSPEAAGSKYLPGVVAVYFVTDLKGRVAEAWPLSGDPNFHRRGVEAAFRNRYSRRKYRGRIIPSAGMVIYKFSGERQVVLDSDVGPAFGCG